MAGKFESKPSILSRIFSAVPYVIIALAVVLTIDCVTESNRSAGVTVSSN